jgi:tripartite ATP-independent transporter DctP family solute receptor
MRKNGKIAIILATVLTLAICLSACASMAESAPGTSSKPLEPVASDEKIITLKFGNVQAVDHPNALAMKEKFQPIIKEKTGNKITVEVFPASQLGNERDLAEGLQIGSIDMANIGIGGMMAIDEKLAVFNIPYLITNREKIYNILDGEVGDELFKTYMEPKGITGLGWFENGFRNVTNSKVEIKSPEDLANLKLRVPEVPLLIQLFKTLEANPTPMAFGEVFTALQQKTIDGQENPLVTIYTSRLYEVQKYVSLTHHVWDPFALMISTAIWNNLSPEQQFAMKEASKATVEYQRELCIKADEEMAAKLREKGMTVTEINYNEFIEKLKPMYDEVIPKFGKDLVDKLRAN